MNNLSLNSAEYRTNLIRRAEYVTKLESNLTPDVRKMLEKRVSDIDARLNKLQPSSPKISNTVVPLISGSQPLLQIEFPLMQIELPVKPAARALDAGKLNTFQDELAKVSAFLVQHNAAVNPNAEYAAIKDLILSGNLTGNPELLFHKDGVFAENLDERYQELQFVTHPDKNFGFGNEATEIFKFIEVAYNLFKA